MWSSFPKDLRDLVNNAISFGLNGRQIDALVAAHGINVLDPAKPVPALAVQVSGPPASSFWPEGGQTGIVHVQWHYALCFDLSRQSRMAFPLRAVITSRCGTFSSSPVSAELSRSGAMPVAAMLPEAFDAALGAEGYEQRIANHCAAHGRRTQAFAGLVAREVVINLRRGRHHLLLQGVLALRPRREPVHDDNYK